jgi:hypothetical protein
MKDVKAKQHNTWKLLWKPLKGKPQGRCGPCATPELAGGSPASPLGTPLPNISRALCYRRTNNRQRCAISM